MHAVLQVEDRLDEVCGGLVVFDHRSLFPIRDQVVNGVTFAVLHESQMADASFGCGDQTLTEGSRVDAVTDGHAFAARFVFAR